MTLWQKTYVDFIGEELAVGKREMLSHHPELAKVLTYCQSAISAPPDMAVPAMGWVRFIKRLPNLFPLSDVHPLR